MGKNLKYSHIDPEEKSRDISQALNWLAAARVITKIHHTSASGLPLRALIHDRKFKVLFLDVGLLVSACGLNPLEIEHTSHVVASFGGALTEQCIGQHLLYAGNKDETPELFYWARDERSSQAEIDYVITIDGKIIPIEVKSGSSGHLKSLLLFAKEKQSPLGVRFWANPTTSEKLLDGKFHLLSLPLYLVEQTHRLVREI